MTYAEEFKRNREIFLENGIDLLADKLYAENRAKINLEYVYSTFQSLDEVILEAGELCKKHNRLQAVKLINSTRVFFGLAEAKLFVDRKFPIQQD